jgi:hypothetical protein
VAPSVAPNLVALIVRSLDQCRVSCLGIVDLSFASVVADNKECSFDTLGFEKIKEIRGVNVRSIVECKSHFSGDRALPDIYAVGDLAKTWSGDRCRICAAWCLVGIAVRAPLE